MLNKKSLRVRRSSLLVVVVTTGLIVVIVINDISVQIGNKHLKPVPSVCDTDCVRQSCHILPDSLVEGSVGLHLYPIDSQLFSFNR